MINLENITKTFPGQCMPTLQGINLQFAHGEFCVLLGDNGSGKSTLLRCISGEYVIDKDNIIINKQDVTKQNKSRFVASVTQDINVGTIAKMTLLENMALSQMRNTSAGFCLYKKHREHIIARLEQFHLVLEQYLDKPLTSLSGGQWQIIATIMAIMSRPQILLLDEHTSALDPHTQQMLMEYTTPSITEHKITTIMITHKLETALQYGDRLIVLNKGKIVLDLGMEEKKALTMVELRTFFARDNRVVA